MRVRLVEHDRGREDRARERAAAGSVNAAERVQSVGSW